MCFGTYGTEPNTLALCYDNGGLEFKMISRQATFQNPKDGGPPKEQEIPLDLPKKTKLYIEQTEREKMYATEMHRTFQRDLCKLRLTTARAYVKVLTDGQGTSYTAGSTLSMSAEVRGLGPQFILKLTVQNTGTITLYNLLVMFTYDKTVYLLPKSSMTVSHLKQANLLTHVYIDTGACSIFRI
jgi:Bardet-Biedl syndrome 1 protein